MEQARLGWQDRIAFGNGYRPGPPVGGDSDDELLRAFTADRCPRAFARIYERHSGMVLRASRRRLTRLQDAEDVVQSVFLDLALRPDLVRVNLAGWLHEAAIRRAINKYRSDQSRQARERDHELLQDGAPPGHVEDLREEIEAALGRLPAPLREAIILCHIEGMTQQEAARVAGCDRGTISRRTAEGMARLRSVLSKRGVVPTGAAVLVCLRAGVPTEGAVGASSPGAAEAILKLAARRGRVSASAWVRVVATASLAVGVLAAGFVAWPSGPPQNGLVGHYRFDEAAGKRVVDSSPARNHGTLVGGVRRAPGRHGGGALEFDGETGYVLLAVDLGRRLQGDASVCFWVRIRHRGGSSWTSPGVLGVTGKKLADLSTCSVWGCVGFDGRLFAQSGCHGQVVSGAALDDGAWHHVAVARSASTGLVQLYVDGTKQAERASEPGPHAQPYRSLGRIEALGGAKEQYFHGALGEVLLYSRVLSEAEVRALAR